MMNIEKAKEFVYRNTRPLDLARWQYLFENGKKRMFLKYQLNIKTKMEDLDMRLNLIVGIQIHLQFKHGLQLKSSKK